MQIVDYPLDSAQLIAFILAMQKHQIPLEITKMIYDEHYKPLIQYKKLYDRFILHLYSPLNISCVDIRRNDGSERVVFYTKNMRLRLEEALKYPRFITYMRNNNAIFAELYHSHYVDIYADTIQSHKTKQRVKSESLILDWLKKIYNIY